jgi:hypothetical protein
LTIPCGGGEKYSCNSLIILDVFELVRFPCRTLYFSVSKIGRHIQGEKNTFLCRFSVNYYTRIFLFSTTFSSTLGPTQPLIQLVPRSSLSLGIKRPGREADNSPPRPRTNDIYLHFPIRKQGVVRKKQSTGIALSFVSSHCLSLK